MITKSGDGTAGGTEAEATARLDVAFAELAAAREELESLVRAEREREREQGRELEQPPED